MTSFASETISHLVHELRTPLGSLRLLGELLAANPTGRLGERELRHAQGVQQIVGDLTALLDEVSMLARLRSARLHVEEEIVRVVRLQQWTAEELERQAGGRGLKLSVRCDADAPETLRSDSEQLREIIGLLVVSAAEATTEGAIRVLFASPSPALLAAADTTIAPRGALLLRITDTGVGVDAAARQAIFTPFHAHRRNARHQGGIKLTLPLARALARLLGGEILLASDEDETALTLLLPAAP